MTNENTTRPKIPPIVREKIPGRNDPCPCKSGRKAKVCCLKAIKWLRDLPPTLRERVVVSRILGRDVAAPVEPVPAPNLDVVERAQQEAREGRGSTIDDILATNNC